MDKVSLICDNDDDDSTIIMVPHSQLSSVPTYHQVQRSSPPLSNIDNKGYKGLLSISILAAAILLPSL